jgi:hypothetical protein
MRGCTGLFGGILLSFVAVSGGKAAVTASFPAMERERAATHTNWVENTVTNLIEVRMSRNRFVTEYRTNWAEHVSTNVFDVYRTNQLVRNVTNRFIVDAWHTNEVVVNSVRTNKVNSYQTNWISRNVTNAIVLTRVQTNFIDSYHTNWKSLTVTNQVAVNLVRTNFTDAYKTNWQNVTFTNHVVLDRVHTNVVDAFATNWQTLLLTNWQTVVVMRTNWVTRFATNVAQIDLPKTVPVTPSAPEKPAVSRVLHTAPATASGSEDPVIEVSRTARPPANGLVEVELKIRWPADTTDAPPVQQWRIEREGGSFLSFGQEQECRKELPVGNYVVQATLQRDADSPSFVLKGTLSVTIKEAVVQQRTDRSKLAVVSPR